MNLERIITIALFVVILAAVVVLAAMLPPM